MKQFIPEQMLFQSFNILADYNDAFNSRRREWHNPEDGKLENPDEGRFKMWGIIPDPTCLKPEEAEAMTPVNLFTDLPARLLDELTRIFHR